MCVPKQSYLCAFVHRTFLTSTNTFLWCCPTGGTKLERNYSLPFLGLHLPRCAFPVWAFISAGSCAGITPMIWSLNFRNRYPQSGLVMKYPIISPVGHHTNDTSPCANLLVINKLWMFIFLVRFLLEAFPFFSRRIELLLSWKIGCPRLCIFEIS